MLVTPIIAWEGVTNNARSLPCSKEREVRPDFHLYGVMQNKEVAGGKCQYHLDKNIPGSGREDGLKREDGGYTPIWLSLVITVYKGPLIKHSTAPVYFRSTFSSSERNLDGLGHAGDNKEKGCSSHSVL